MIVISIYFISYLVCILHAGELGKLLCHWIEKKRTNFKKPKEESHNRFLKLSKTLLFFLFIICFFPIVELALVLPAYLGFYFINLEFLKAFL